MSITKRPSSRRAGFSLIEMIGVLAIIAILAAVIVPRVFATIASSRVTSAVGATNTIKSAISEFSGKFGALPVTNANARIDDLLLTTGIIDQRFSVKIGNQPTNPPAGATWTRNAQGAWTAAGGANQNTTSRIICLNSNAAAPATGNNYLLDGTNNLPTGSRVVSAVLVQVTGNEALELSTRIDGPAYTQPDTTTADTRGKVIYAAPNGAGFTNVYVYLAHQ